MRLLQISGKEVEKILVKLGWYMTGQKGSHMYYEHPDKKDEGGRNIIVTVPDHKELRFGTTKLIIRKMGLSVEEFYEMRNKK